MNPELAMGLTVIVILVGAVMLSSRSKTSPPVRAAAIFVHRRAEVKTGPQKTAWQSKLAFIWLVCLIGAMLGAKWMIIPCLPIGLILMFAPRLKPGERTVL